MSNKFEKMTLKISRSIYKTCFESPNRQSGSNQYIFFDEIKKIKGLEEDYENKVRGGRKKLAELSYLADVVKTYCVENGYDEDYHQRNTRVAIEGWSKGTTDILKYSKSSKKSSTPPNNHFVTFLSAINDRFDFLSKPGDSFSEHIESVKRFISKIASNGCHTAPSVVFYSRSLSDVAFMYCTYMRLPNTEFVRIAQELTDVLEDAQSDLIKANKEKRKKGIYPTHAHHSTSLVKTEVVRDIFDTYLCDAIQKEGVEKTCDNISQRGEMALEELKNYIRENPTYFLDHRQYSVIRQMMQYMLNPNQQYYAAFSDGGILKDLIKTQKKLVELFAEVEIPEDENEKNKSAQKGIKGAIQKRDKFALKDVNCYNLYFTLWNLIRGSCAAADAGNDKFHDIDEVFGIKRTCNYDTYNANTITLLRFAIIVSISEYYFDLRSKCRPNEVSLYSPENILNTINDIMDEFGLVRLHGILRKGNYLDWCLYKYIKDEKIRNNANACICMRNGANHEL